MPSKKLIYGHVTGDLHPQIKEVQALLFSQLSLGALVGDDEMELGQMVSYRASSLGLSPHQMPAADFGVGGGGDSALDGGAVDLGPNALMHAGSYGERSSDSMSMRGAHDFEHDTGFLFDLWQSSPNMAPTDGSARSERPSSSSGRR